MLQLVPALAAADGTDDPFSPREERRAAAGRPGDLREPWDLKADANVRGLAEQAFEIPLHLDTAVALVVERELVRRPLAAAGHEGMSLDAVDAVAAEHANVRLALPGADAVYLRSLTRGAEIDEQRLRVPLAGSSIRVGLPARLSARLLAAGGPQGLIAHADLGSAVRLEIAAVCAGQTMSEWAAWAALGI